MRTHTRATLARSARSCAPLRLPHSHHKTQPTPPRQTTSTSKRGGHSLASLARVLPIPSDPPPAFPPQDATNTKSGRHSLASLARGLPCGSPFPPIPLRLPPSLRSVGLPASYARGKPPHSVSRAGEGAAQSPVHLLGPYSLRSPSGGRLSVAALAAARPIEARLAKSFNVFGGSGAPCGGRGYRGGPRPAKGANTPASAKASAPLLRPAGAALAALGRIGAYVRPTAGLLPAYGRPTARLRLASGWPTAGLRPAFDRPPAPRPPLRSGRRFVRRPRGPPDAFGSPRCGGPSARLHRETSPAVDIL